MSEHESGKTQENRKKGRERKLTTVLLIAAVAVMVFALARLIPIIMDYRNSEDAYMDLAGDIVDAGTDEEETEAEEETDWSDVVIDFSSLKEINSDVVGWIRFDDTTALPIDYPILHGETDNTYLRTNLYGESHTAGSIFLESANSPDFSDLYNIIYGHNMRNNTMFGSLKQYKRDEDFYDENPFFTIYTEEGAYRYQIFTYEEIKDDSSFYSVGYAADDAYQDLIDEIVAGSMRDTGITPTAGDRIVMLSTCTSTGDDYRFVVFGVCTDQVIY